MILLTNQLDISKPQPIIANDVSAPGLKEGERWVSLCR
jgi:hypothetical protein